MISCGGNCLADHSKSHIGLFLPRWEHPTVPWKHVATEIEIGAVGRPCDTFEISAYGDDAIVVRYGSMAHTASDAGSTSVCGDQYPGAKDLHTSAACDFDADVIRARMKSVDAMALENLRA